MAKRKPIIQVPHGTVPKICKAFRCKRSTVYAALCFDSKSELSENIRQSALTVYGGVKTTKLILN